MFVTPYADPVLDKSLIEGKFYTIMMKTIMNCDDIEFVETTCLKFYLNADPDDNLSSLKFDDRKDDPCLLHCTCIAATPKFTMTC